MTSEFVPGRGAYDPHSYTMALMALFPIVNWDGDAYNRFLADFRQDKEAQQVIKDLITPSITPDMAEAQRILEMSRTMWSDRGQQPPWEFL